MILCCIVVLYFFLHIYVLCGCWLISLVLLVGFCKNLKIDFPKLPSTDRPPENGHDARSGNSIVISHHPSSKK